MFKFIITILLAISSPLFSQEKITFYLKDKETKEPIEQAIIKINQNNKYLLSDSKGKVELIANAIDTLFVSHLDYKLFKIDVNRLKKEDTLFLEYKYDTLNTIVIGRNSPILLGNYNIKKGGFDKIYHNSSPTFQMALLIEDSLYADNIIKKLYFQIHKGSFHERIFRIHLYENKNNLPFKDLLTKEIIFSTNNIKKNEYSINIADLNIKFPKNGVFLAIETIAVIEHKTNKIFYEPFLKNKIKEPPLFKLSTSLITYKKPDKNIFEFWEKSGWINKLEKLGAKECTTPAFWIEL